jgi:hypothetical protein
VFTRWLGHDGRVQRLAFEVKLDPLLRPATGTPLGEHGGSLVLDDGGASSPGRRPFPPRCRRLRRPGPRPCPLDGGRPAGGRNARLRARR